MSSFSRCVYSLFGCAKATPRLYMKLAEASQEKEDKEIRKVKEIRGEVLLARRSLCSYGPPGVKLIDVNEPEFETRKPYWPASDIN